MAKVKFDKEKAGTLITDLTTLKSNIDSCLDDINGCGQRKNNRDSDMLVVETKTRSVTTVVDGVSQTTLETYTVNTYPYDSKVSSYNGALESIQTKATALKNTSARISKVIDALKKVDSLIDDFENSSGLTMSSELGDVADHDFSFLDKYGTSGSAGLVGPLGYLSSVFGSIDLTEFNRLGDEIITSSGDYVPEHVLDFDDDGKISLTDYLKSMIKEDVNEDGKVVINGQEVGDFDTFSLSSLLTVSGVDSLVEKIEKGISEDFGANVDVNSFLETMATIKNLEGDVTGGEVALGALPNSVVGLGNLNSEESIENRYNALFSILTEDQKNRFDENTAGLTLEEKLELLQSQHYEGLQQMGGKPHLGGLTEEGMEEYINDLEENVEAAGENVGEFASAVGATSTLAGVSDKIGDMGDKFATAVDKPYNDVGGKPSNNSYDGGHQGGGHPAGNGGGHRGGGHYEEPKPEAPTQTHTQPPTQPSTQPQTQPPTQPQTQPPSSNPATSPETQPLTQPETQPPRNVEKPHFEVVSKGEDNDMEMPILKNDETVIETEEKTTASSALLGAAGIGAGTVLSGSGNSAAIPSVDLGVSTPAAPMPSTMTTQNSVSTTVQNNTPMTGVTPDMDDVASQKTTIHQGSGTTGRTTADTSSEGFTNGKTSTHSSSSSTSKQSKDTLSKDGEFKDDKDNNNSQNNVDTSKPEGVLGEASYAELIAKEEKQIKIATAITASSMAVSIVLSLASVIDVIMLVLLLLAAILAYSVFRGKKKKNIKKLEALIKIEKIKKEETVEVVAEETTEDKTETSEETSTEEEIQNESTTEEEKTSENDKSEVSKIKEVEEIVSEKKEFQSAEEVIYGEMPQHSEVVEEKETETTK